MPKSTKPLVPLVTFDPSKDYPCPPLCTLSTPYPGVSPWQRHDDPRTYWIPNVFTRYGRAVACGIYLAPEAALAAREAILDALEGGLTETTLEALRSALQAPERHRVEGHRDDRLDVALLVKVAGSGAPSRGTRYKLKGPPTLQKLRARRLAKRSRARQLAARVAAKEIGRES